MDRADLLKKFALIVCDVLNKDDLVILEETQAPDVEGWDSMANITILAIFEDETGVRFDISEIESFKNVGDILDAVINHA